jgi:hypothetical protein
MVPVVHAQQLPMAAPPPPVHFPPPEPDGQHNIERFRVHIKNHPNNGDYKK